MSIETRQLICYITLMLSVSINLHTHRYTVVFLLEQHCWSGGTYHREGKRAICGSHKQLLIAWTCLTVTELVDKPAVKGHQGDMGLQRFLTHLPTHMPITNSHMLNLE